jgi:hypothetical protein
MFNLRCPLLSGAARKEEKQGQKGVAIKSTKLPDIRPIKYTSYSTHNTGSFIVQVNTESGGHSGMETKVYVVFDVIKTSRR